MIHGQKKTKKQKTKQQKQQDFKLSERISTKLVDFFQIRNKPITTDNIQKMIDFTSILMQLCSQISTIFNYRRQLLQNIMNRNNQNQLKQTITIELKLLSKLIQDDPKSYTLWSYRQWLIQICYKFMPQIANKQKKLCQLLLNKDQKNFHVWNYRNWVNSIEIDLMQQLKFTENKIKTNPFNFSAYHFRSKHLHRHYIQILLSQKQAYNYKEIIIYGMPRQVFQQQIQRIQTAIFLNPNQQAPWIYYNWLLKQLLPILQLKNQINQNKRLIIFNKKINSINQLLTKECKQTKAISMNKQLPSNDWIITPKQITIESNINLKSLIAFYLKNQCIFIQEQNQSVIDDIKEIYTKELSFLREVIDSENSNVNNCRFVKLQILEINKLLLECGTTPHQWDQIVDNSLLILEQLSCAKIKGFHYIIKQKEQWKRLSNLVELSLKQLSLRSYNK